MTRVELEEKVDKAKRFACLSCPFRSDHCGDKWVCLDVIAEALEAK